MQCKPIVSGSAILTQPRAGDSAVQMAKAKRTQGYIDLCTYFANALSTDAVKNNEFPESGTLEQKIGKCFDNTKEVGDDLWLCFHILLIRRISPSTQCVPPTSLPQSLILASSLRSQPQCSKPCIEASIQASRLKLWPLHSNPSLQALILASKLQP